MFRDLNMTGGFQYEAQGIAECIRTRLKLYEGEYLLDTSIGMPWQEILGGKVDLGKLQVLLRREITGVDGVLGITSIHTEVINRSLIINLEVKTVHGDVQIQEMF